MARNSVLEAQETLPIVFRFYTPKPPLSEFVELFWYWRGHEVQYAKERILPMATSELVIDLARGPSKAGISGPQSESFIIKRTAQDELLGIHFRIGGAFPFIEFPVGELHDANITLGELWGDRQAGELLCRLHETTTIEMKFQVLETWLMRIASRPLKHHPVVSFAISEFRRDSNLLSSAAVADRSGFSQRRFIEIFRDEVGLTPKLFCRVQRFQ